MPRPFVAGVAGLSIVSAVGAAHAADVMPIVVAVTPVATAALAGPTMSVELEQRLHVALYGLDFLSARTSIEGSVEVRTRSGWGFKFEAGAGTQLTNSFGLTGYTLHGEVFRAVRAMEFGVFLEVWDGGLVSLGPILRYDSRSWQVDHVVTFYPGAPFVIVDTDTKVVFSPAGPLKVETNLEAEFSALGNGATLDAEVTYDLTERLQLTGNLYTSFPAPFLALEGGVRVDLGAFTPYAGASWNPINGWGANVGAELEHALGTGPFALIGDARLDFFPTYPPDLTTMIGIRYRRGATD